MYRIILFLSLSTIVSGCTWVSLTSAGEGVRLMGAVNVGNCQRIGATMGGNAIIPESVIQNGAQSFGVFSCPR
jgi:hypothetical protein